MVAVPERKGEDRSQSRPPRARSEYREPFFGIQIRDGDRRAGFIRQQARSLAQFGLTWDATRLASQAALQTDDARVSGAMLQLARDLKMSTVDQTAVADQAVATATPTTTSAAPQQTPHVPVASRLSDREREVAELLLQGMPYRDIGSQLFISAKTVEHHVARIRRRLGAESRSELLSMLRATLG